MKGQIVRETRKSDGHGGWIGSGIFNTIPNPLNGKHDDFWWELKPYLEYKTHEQNPMLVYAPGRFVHASMFQTHPFLHGCKIRLEDESIINASELAGLLDWEGVEPPTLKKCTLTITANSHD